MENNNTIESKIKKYAALAGGITAVAGVANAQIVHTDINPDTLITGNGALYNLDVDNNGVIDFTFYTIASSITYSSGSSSTCRYSLIGEPAPHYSTGGVQSTGPPGAWSQCT